MARAEPTGAKAGDRALTLDETRASMLAWVDELFQDSIDRLYDGSGWLPRAYLTYFAGPPDGKHAKMVEMLVVSIHEFSQIPIVVMHFGMCAPADWTPERFPRMVLMHMGPLPGKLGVSQDAYLTTMTSCFFLVCVHYGAECSLHFFLLRPTMTQIEFS